MLCSWHRQVPETCLIKLDQLLDSKMKYNAECGLRKLNPGGCNTGILVQRQTTEADQRWAGVWEGENVYLPNSDSAPFLCTIKRRTWSLQTHTGKMPEVRYSDLGKDLHSSPPQTRLWVRSCMKREPTQPANQNHHTLPPIPKASTDAHQQRNIGSGNLQEETVSTWTTLLLPYT